MRYPDYYNKFNCIADKCKHSCCIGWEIDIDIESYNRFINTSGELGNKLRRNISNNAFILDENERCPFLRDDYLCELIINKGEGFLCDICTEHPRFYNCYNSITEMGIGACCEVAALLILKEDMVLVFEDEADASDREINLTLQEKIFFDIRDEYIIKLEKLTKGIISSHIDERVIYKFTELERLDEKWSGYLESALLFVRKNKDVQNRKAFLNDENGGEYRIMVDCLRRFATYLVYRHSIRFYEKNEDKLNNNYDYDFLKSSFFDIFDNFISDCIAIVWAVFLANREFYKGFSSHFNECASEISLFEEGGNVVDLLSDIIRYFSSEVEYSDINLIGWFT